MLLGTPPQKKEWKKKNQAIFRFLERNIQQTEEMSTRFWMKENDSNIYNKDDLIQI